MNRPIEVLRTNMFVMCRSRTSEQHVRFEVAAEVHGHVMRVVASLGFPIILDPKPRLEEKGPIKIPFLAQWSSRVREKNSMAVIRSRAWWNLKGRVEDNVQRIFNQFLRGIIHPLDAGAIDVCLDMYNALARRTRGRR